jgi:hypothetical protein
MNIDGLISDTILNPEERHTSSDGYKGEEMIHVSDNLLCFYIISHIAFLIQTSCIESGSLFLIGLPTY